MKADIADLWIAKLRSGTIEQAKEALNNGLGMCCLGVLCQLHLEAHSGIEWQHGGYYFSEGTALPKEVCQWAGMESDGGVLPETVWFPDGTGSAGHLAALNDDGGMDFTQIADVIEKYKDQL